MTPDETFGSIRSMDEPWSAPLLLERIQIVLEQKGWKPADWTRAAGLPESKRTHLSNLMARLESNPNATVEVPLIAQLARAAEVSLDWLILNRGNPFVRELTPERDPLYPSRGPALSAARFLGFRDRAIAKVRAINDLPKDPGTPYWLTLLNAESEADRLAGGSSTPPAPADGSRSQRGAARKHR